MWYFLLRGGVGRRFYYNICLFMGAARCALLEERHFKKISHIWHTRMIKAFKVVFMLVINKQMSMECIVNLIIHSWCSLHKMWADICWTGIWHDSRVWQSLYTFRSQRSRRREPRVHRTWIWTLAHAKNALNGRRRRRRRDCQGKRHYLLYYTTRAHAHNM